MPFSTTWSTIKDFANGGKLFPSDLDDALADLGNQVASVNVAGGFNEGSNVRRGKFIQSTAGTRTNTAYGPLSNGPDEVPNIVLPTNGLILIYFQALWQSSVAASASAIIYLNAAALLVSSTAGAPALPAVVGPTTANVDNALVSSQIGLISQNGAVNQTEVTTGQVVGVSANAPFAGEIAVFAAAGTYAVGVSYKSTSGSVTVKNRKLWVRTENY